jgi:PleD family two-component response regulator
MSVVKNINKDIENVEVNGKRLNLSLSVGVTEMKIEDNLERLFKRAQEAVCLAKQKGGARVDYLEHFLLFE